jgi:hypothetical protein
MLKSPSNPQREDGTAGPRRWLLRLTINAKRRNHDLGGYPLVTLEPREPEEDAFQPQTSAALDLDD